MAMNTPRSGLQGLVDRDIKPKEVLWDGVGDLVDLEAGGESSEDELIEDLAGTEILYTTSRLPLTEHVFRNADSLEFIGKSGTGTDTIDLDAAAATDVTVTYTPGVNAHSVAEHAMALLLAVNHNVVRGQRTLEAGGWRDELPNKIPLAGTTIGIVGFGNVGSRLAGLLSGFNVDVLAYDPYVHDIDTQITGATLTDLETVLAESAAVVVTAEHTEETRGMIDRDAFAVMRSDAVFVNVARGPLVDTDTLLDALETDSIAGAGLDVFETEPLRADSPLHSFENLVVTPHIAGSSARARREVLETLVSNTRTYLASDSIPDRFVAARPDSGP